MIGHAQGCDVETGDPCTCSYVPGPRDPMGALLLLVEAYTIGDRDDQQHAMDVANQVLRYASLAAKGQARIVAGECGRCDRAVQQYDGTWVDAMGSDQCAAGGRHQVIQAPDGYHLCPGCMRMHAYPTDGPRPAPAPTRPGVRLTCCRVCLSVYLGSAWCHDLPTDLVVVDIVTGPLPV